MVANAALRRQLRPEACSPMAVVLSAVVVVVFFFLAIVAPSEILAAILVAFFTRLGRCLSGLASVAAANACPPLEPPSRTNQLIQG